MSNNISQTKSSTFTGKQQTTSTQTPITEMFGRDLTRLASQAKLDPIIGREAETDAVAQILAKKKKNNAILIGPAGVGKTAIAELLAQKIIQQSAPPSLLDMRIIEIDLTSIFAGASMQGQVESRVQSIINELSKVDNVILFIDEVHLLTTRTAGGIDLANMLKPALARGVLKVIAATTLDEYREHIETDKALKRRFEEVIVNEPSLEDTNNILGYIKSYYEDYHNVSIPDSIIPVITDYCERFITDRTFPDKAIDILDSTCAHVRLKNPPAKNKTELKIRTELATLNSKKSKLIDENDWVGLADINSKVTGLEKTLEILKTSSKSSPRTVVTTDDVADVVSAKTGVPITKISSNQASIINSLEHNLSSSVIGQQEAVKAIVSAVRRAKAGLSDPKRPQACLLFLGPTGVGKTEITKQLAAQLFLSEKDLIKLDMSEYGENHTVSALIGAPAGYVGYGKGGGLTEKVRKKPNSIILLDEIEKAHPDVHKLFLQVLDEGKLTDRIGNEINFKNTIIIMTSNTGVTKVRDFGGGIGFTTDSTKRESDNKELLLKELKKSFPPEFLNRIDDVIVFNQLTDDDKKQILDINLDKFQKQVANIESGGYSVKFTQALKDFLMSIGYDPDMGARPLNRAITQHVVNNLAEFLFEKQPKQGSKITIDYNNKVVIK